MYKIEYNGKVYTIKELAEMAGLPYHTVYVRLKKMSVEEALNKTVIKKEKVLNKKAIKKYEYKSKYYTIAELADMANVPYATMHSRLKKMPVEEALYKEYPTEKRFEYKGKEYTIPELAKMADTTDSAIRNRLKRMTVEEALKVRNVVRRPNVKKRTCEVQI